MNTILNPGATLPEAPAQDVPTLGLQDIQNTLKIIDFAADQGAFKGWNTIQQVLLVRTKIATFLECVEKEAANQQSNAQLEL